MIQNKLFVLTELPKVEGPLYDCCEGYQYEAEPRTQWPEQPVPPPDDGLAGRYSLKYVPEYLQLTWRPEPGYRLQKYTGITGYAIQLTPYDGIEDYMLRHFEKRNRGNLLRAVRRLETCFDIRYTRYYGDISGDILDNLTSRLKGMISERFRERQQQSDTLKNWAKITGTLAELIRSKRASLFVISHNDQPVSISVSYHLGDLFFYYITSYDTDYSKFSLGNTMLYKQLEWAFENGYRFFEMGWGDLDYKRRWSDTMYPYASFEYYPKNSIAHWLAARKEILKTRMLSYLLAKQVNVKVRRLKHKIIPYPNPVAAPKFRPATKSPQKGKAPAPGDPISRDSPELQEIKPLVMDFLYTTEAHYSEVLVFRRKPSGYWLQSKGHFQELVPVGDE